MATVSFKRSNGLLYRVTINQEGMQVKEKQLVVPKKYRDNVVKKGHESVVAGHVGISRTVKRIHSKYYWTRMYVDIKRYCKSCNNCKIAKHSN